MSLDRKFVFKHFNWENTLSASAELGERVKMRSITAMMLENLFSYFLCIRTQSLLRRSLQFKQRSLTSFSKIILLSNLLHTIYFGYIYLFCISFFNIVHSISASRTLTPACFRTESKCWNRVCNSLSPNSANLYIFLVITCIFQPRSFLFLYSHLYYFQRFSRKKTF